MSVAKKLLLTTGCILIIGTEVILSILLSAPEGIRITSPQANDTTGLSFRVTGNAWIKNGLDEIIVTAVSDSGEKVISTGQRTLVSHGVRDPFFISAFSADLELPKEGEWALFFFATGKDGEIVSAPHRSITTKAGIESHSFIFWTPPHYIPMILIAVMSICLVVLLRLKAGAAFQEKVKWFLAIMIWANEIFYHIYWYTTGAWSPASSLSVHMCGISNLLIPFMFFLEKGKLKTILFEFLFFWATAGGIIALLFPDMGGHAFPSIKYFTFYISHGGIILCMAVAAAHQGYCLSFRSLLRATGLSMVGMAAIFLADLALRLIPPYEPANYMLLAYPPPGDPALALFAVLFGPAPAHALGVAGFFLAGYLVIFLALLVTRLISRMAGVQKTIIPQ